MQNHIYEPKTFALGELDGISKKTVEEHLGLYQGYVKNFNVITALIAEFLRGDSEKNAHAIAELMRRRSFEFGGMRLHELYFSQFENGAAPLAAGSALALALREPFGDVDTVIARVRKTGMMRGPGWSLLYYDAAAKQFHVGFSGEQHQGHFVTLPIILALDVWEHAFILDYGAQGKAKYIDAFFKNVNWTVMESRFAAAG